MSDYQIIRNDYGFFELDVKPDPQAIADFYAEKYFQADLRYSHHYDETERRYLGALFKRKLALLDSLDSFSMGRVSSVLEVGVGEGWTLAALKHQFHQVEGLDFSDHACKHHNPEVAAALEVGNPDDLVEQRQQQGRQYDLLWLDNVLEHSLDPGALLKSLASVADPGAHLVVEVPNDYSLLQNYCVEHQLVDGKPWECPPEHISYFNLDGLSALAADAGWTLQRAIADFPIDLFLLNPASNYYRNGEVGKSAHRARIAFDNLMSEQPMHKVLAYYESMLALGLGRQIVAVFSAEGA